MDFGPFGAAEVLFIAALALVVFGPKRLPELSRAAGRMMTRLKRATTELQRTYEAELDQVPRLSAITDEVEDLGRSAQRELGGPRGLAQDLRSVARDVEDVVAEARKLPEPAAPSVPKASGRPDGD